MICNDIGLTDITREALMHAVDLLECLVEEWPKVNSILTKSLRMRFEIHQTTFKQFENCPIRLLSPSVNFQYPILWMVSGEFLSHKSSGVCKPTGCNSSVAHKDELIYESLFYNSRLLNQET